MDKNFQKMAILTKNSVILKVWTEILPLALAGNFLESSSKCFIFCVVPLVKIPIEYSLPLLKGEPDFGKFEKGGSPKNIQGGN